MDHDILIYELVNAILWIWWCDSTPNRRGTIPLTIIWLSFYNLIGFYVKYIYYILESAASNLKHFVFFKVNGGVCFWSMPHFPLFDHGAMFFATFAIVLVGYLIYKHVFPLGNLLVQKSK